MEQQTGTEELVFDTSDATTQASEATTEQMQDSSAAVEETTEQTTSGEQEASAEPAATEEAQTGDAIDEFLAKKGIKTDDPDALRKVAEMYRNVEKGFYSKSQENAQLARKLADSRIPEARADQEALSEVRALRTERNVERWMAEHKITPEEEAKMAEYCQRPMTDANGNARVNPATGQPLTMGLAVLNGILTLDDVYRLTNDGKAKELDNLKQSYREEVLKEAEARQAAKRPAANATNSTQFSKPTEDDPLLDGLFGR